MRNVDRESRHGRWSPRAPVGELITTPTLQSLVCFVPRLQSVVTKPSKPRRGVEDAGWPGESDTFWRESLLATLCFFPLGLIALCASLEVWCYSICSLVCILELSHINHLELLPCEYWICIRQALYIYYIHNIVGVSLTLSVLHLHGLIHFLTWLIFSGHPLEQWGKLWQSQERISPCRVPSQVDIRVLDCVLCHSGAVVPCSHRGRDCSWNWLGTHKNSLITTQPHSYIAIYQLWQLAHSFSPIHDVPLKMMISPGLYYSSKVFRMCCSEQCRSQQCHINEWHYQSTIITEGSTYFCVSFKNRRA